MTSNVFVGYDTREDIAYQVCEFSIKRFNANVAITPLVQHELRQKKIYWREIDKLASTEFTFTRFLVPHLMNFKGWALFIDCDIVFLEDVNNFSLADDRYAVMCVKHEFNPKPGLKMDGQVQTVYPRKNWSSVVLWNCAHPSNEKVTVDSVNNPNFDGAYFHRFSWLKDEEIGELPCDWNWLVGWYKKDDGVPRAIHYTEGGPWFKNYRNCEFTKIGKMFTGDDGKLIA